MSELKPCPFCGGECELIELQFEFDLKQYASHPNNNCILYSLPLVPVRIWNTRPLEDALQKEVDKLCVELNTNSTQISIQNDSIINMQKRIDELEEQLRWRPVSEKPTKIGVYEVSNPPNVTIAYWFDGAWRHSPMQSAYDKAFPVIGWRPIPEPPEVKHE